MYDEIVDRLNRISQFAPSTGVERGRRVLRNCGNPEKDLKIIHVAGTNGKGSTCAYIAQILQSNGYKTGLFTSPHLVDIRERIKINGQMISKSDFEEAYNAVENCRTQELAYFDYMLVMAMYYFKKQNVDYVVMETGLGGRLDATNAIENPVISVITTISLEHAVILGDTVEKIAAEKAGIIKLGIPVVCSGVVKEAARVIKSRAEEMESDCCVVDENTFELVQNTYGYIDFLIHNEYYKNDCFRLSTNALYQMENASIALTVCANLCDRGMIKLDNKAVSMAMYDTHWAGRMELLRDNLYVDGAHNPQGIQSFVDSVNSLYENSRLDKATLLFSVVSDKNYDRIIKILCSCKHFRQIYVTITGGVRKLPADIIKETFEAHIKDTPVYVFESVEEAMKKWDNRLMFATGSLYLVGDVDRALEGKENNHD